MEENRENPIRNSEKIERNPDGTLKKGVVLNPYGRPKGSEDFKTKFYRVIDKLAKQNNITPEEVEEQILLVGYKRAKDGDYSFYRDLMDRLHGRPIQKQELTGADGKELPAPILNYVFSDNKPQENSSNVQEDTSSTGGDISIENNLNPIVVDSSSTNGQGENPDLDSIGVNSSLETRGDARLQEHNDGSSILEGFELERNG